MNTALKNDSLASVQPTKTGGYSTTNLYRLANTTIDVESNLKGLGNRLNNSDDTLPPPVEEGVKAINGNRNSFYMEGKETRIDRSLGSVTAMQVNRFEYPLIDHQDHSVFQELQRGGFHTRNNTKDEFAVKCDPRS